MAVILVVEDSVLIRESAVMLIRDWGYETLSASDADEALVLLGSPAQIDALFTDIHLKKAVFGGCGLAREAIALRPTLRVLYTTGNTVTDEMTALFLAGTYCLPKPYSPEQLQGSVERMLAA